jgi:hypothetical protein
MSMLKLEYFICFKTSCKLWVMTDIYNICIQKNFCMCADILFFWNMSWALIWLSTINQLHNCSMIYLSCVALIIKSILLFLATWFSVILIFADTVWRYRPVNLISLPLSWSKLNYGFFFCHFHLHSLVVIHQI